MVVAGTFILCFGWFGFNPGSTLSGTDLRISAVVVNTMLAGVAGCITTMLYMMMIKMKPDPTMMCNGMLAGLVAITAPCVSKDHAKKNACRECPEGLACKVRQDASVWKTTGGPK